MRRYIARESDRIDSQRQDFFVRRISACTRDVLCCPPQECSPGACSEHRRHPPDRLAPKSAPTPRKILTGRCKGQPALIYRMARWKLTRLIGNRSDHLRSSSATKNEEFRPRCVAWRIDDFTFQRAGSRSRSLCLRPVPPLLRTWTRKVSSRMGRHFLRGRRSGSCVNGLSRPCAGLI